MTVIKSNEKAQLMEGTCSLRFSAKIDIGGFCSNGHRIVLSQSQLMDWSRPRGTNLLRIEFYMTEKDRTAAVLETLQSKGDLYARVSIFEQKRISDLEEAIDHIVHCNIYISIPSWSLSRRIPKSMNFVENPKIQRFELWIFIFWLPKMLIIEQMEWMLINKLKSLQRRYEYI